MSIIDIRSTKDYRFVYEYLMMLSELPDSRKRRKRIVEAKRSLRRYAHRNLDFEARIIKDYGIDGFISLERLPDDIKDIEEARQFFDTFMTYECAPSMYDCTGQRFTSWFKVFERRGHFYAFHRISVDV